MKDGKTRQIATPARPPQDEFLAKHTVCLVLTSGLQSGHEIPIEKPRVTLGRAADADVVLSDASVSYEHAALEAASSGFRLRDLNSTNGVFVNGSRTHVAELKHGDRFTLGSVELRYLAEPRTAALRVHQLDDEL